jgi:hypothetical protein
MNEICVVALAGILISATAFGQNVRNAKDAAVWAVDDTST